MSDTCTQLDWVADVRPTATAVKSACHRRAMGAPPHELSCRPVGCQSYEPGEHWWYCYIDDLAFLFDSAPSFAHP